MSPIETKKDQQTNEQGLGSLEEYSCHSDSTSSYDSEGDDWFSHITMEILHGEGSPSLQHYMSAEDRAPLGNQNGHSPLACKRKYSSSLTGAPEQGARQDSVFRDSTPKTMNDLYWATKPFYATAPVQDVTFRLPPLLDVPEQGPKPKKTRRASSEPEYPKPYNRNPKKILNELESNQVPCPLSPAATITFQEALVATDKPRLVTLSIPPFLVVHANSAYTDIMGFPSTEVLGRPLYECLGKDIEEEFHGSVTGMHGSVVPIASSQETGARDMCRCFANVSLVGPEVSDISLEVESSGMDQEEAPEDDTAFFVTHYCVELEPVKNGGEKKASMGSYLRRAMVSPGSESSCAFGVLG